MPQPAASLAAHQPARQPEQPRAHEPARPCPAQREFPLSSCSTVVCSEVCSEVCSAAQPLTQVDVVGRAHERHAVQRALPRQAQVVEQVPHLLLLVQQVLRLWAGGRWAGKRAGQCTGEAGRSSEGQGGEAPQSWTGLASNQRRRRGAAASHSWRGEIILLCTRAHRQTAPMPGPVSSREGWISRRGPPPRGPHPP